MGKVGSTPTASEVYATEICAYMSSEQGCVHVYLHTLFKAWLQKHCTV